MKKITALLYGVLLFLLFPASSFSQAKILETPKEISKFQSTSVAQSGSTFKNTASAKPIKRTNRPIPAQVNINHTGDLIIDAKMASADSWIQIRSIGNSFEIQGISAENTTSQIRTQSNNGFLVNKRLVTGTIVVHGGSGDDWLTIDLSEEDLFKEVVFYGHGQRTLDGDGMSVIGNRSLNAEYIPDSNISGNGVVRTASSTFVFKGLEPIDLSGFGTVFINSPPGNAEILSLDNGFDFATGTIPAVVISGTTNAVAIESMAAWNNTTLVLDVNSGTDSITLNSANNAHSNTNLRLIDGGDTGDVTLINGPVAVNGNFEIIAETLTISDNITAGADIITTSQRNTLVNGGAVVEVSNGAVNMTAGTSPNVGDNFIGIDLNASTIQATGTGTVSLNGNGSNDGTLDGTQGVWVRGNATVTSGDGIIDINGIGGNGANFLFGVRINGTIQSGNGNISLNGTGGNGSGNLNIGILMQSGTVESTGTGSVSLTGMGGTGVTGQRGISFEQVGTTVRSNGGGIILDGTAGVGSGIQNSGIVFVNGITISDLSNGNIAITGVGDGSGTNQNSGMIFSGTPVTSISSAGGNIGISGTAGASSGSLNDGITIGAETTISTTGVGTIMLDGTGGNAGSNNNRGVLLTGTGSVISSIDGAISISGDATDTTGNGNDGVQLNLAINTTGTGGVSIIGDAGAATNSAIFLNSGAGDINAGGPVTLTSNLGPITSSTGIPAGDLISGTTLQINGELRAGNTGNGIITASANVSLNSGDIFAVSISAVTTAGTDFDQLVVTGTVDVTDATLTLVDNVGGILTAGDTVTIIDNDGSDPVAGTFSGLAQGASIPFNGQFLFIYYDGGDGNDVVLVVDSPPTAMCQDITVQLDATGSVTILASQVDNGSSDPDGPVTLSLDEDTFDCGDVGPNTVTLTVTDSTGNTATCTATVTVEDNIPPAITCPADITVNNDPGICGAVVMYTAPVGTDNCPGSTTTQTAGLPSGSTFPVGTTTNTFVVTDASGNTASCSFDVIVNDTEDPVITCPGNITVSNDPGDCGTAVFYSVNVSDNCPVIMSQTFTFSGVTDTFTVPAGVTSITIEAAGAQGGFSGGLGASISGTFAVTPGESLNLVVGGEGGSRTNNGGVGGGGGGSFVWTTSGPTLLIAAGGGGGNAGNGNGIPGDGSATNAPSDSTNGSGNSAGGSGGNGGSGGALVAPATCEAGGGAGAGWFTNGGDGASPNAPLSGGGIIPLSGGAGGNEGPNCGFTPAGSAVGGFGGGGGGGGVSGAGGGGGGYNGGGGGNSWAGNSTPGWGAGGGGGSFNVGSDQINLAGVQSGNGEIIISYEQSVMVTQTAGLPSGSTFPVGTTTNTFEVTDTSGNTATCSFDVTVNDTEPPVVTCPADITVSNTAGMCSAVVNFAGSATDNCPGTTISYNPASGSAFPVGTTVVTATATDASGNMSTCTFNVTVNDTEPPAITCPADITVGNDPGICGAVVMYTAPVGTDNCPGSTTTQTAGLPSGSTFPVGTTTNTFVVTDASGNTASCSFDVTVNDVEAPTISCPANIVVDNDPGICGAVVTYADPTVMDNCGTSSLQAGNAPTTTAGDGGAFYFDISVGSNDIVLSEIELFTQGEGSNMNIDIYIISGGTYVGNQTNAAAWGGLVASATGIGNVYPATSILELDSPLTLLAGTNYGVALLYDIGHDPVYHNSGTTQTFSNSDLSLISGSATQGHFSGAVYNPRVFDGRIGYAVGSEPTVIQTAGLPSGSTFPVGTTTNTFEVTDASGNTATCSFDVIVNDTEDPVITCPGNITVNNDPGLCSAVVTYATPVGTDNCSGSTTMQTAGLPSGSAFPVGTTTNTFVVTDSSGNTATCSFDVTVNDNEPPMAVCMDITVQLDANGMASIVPSDVDGGSSDNCGIASLAVSPSTFDCSDVGTNTVTLTVTDTSGNSSTCTATVTVEDNVPPVAVCMDITIQLDNNGMASIVAGDIDGGSTDACGIASISASQTDFDCSHVGPNNVTLTVTDVNGNMSTCVAVVTVEDNVPPVIACPADITASTTPGDCFAEVSFAPAIALDACGIASVVQTMGPPSGSQFPVGTTTIEFTATDTNGNTSTCTFDITVTDDEPAMAVCMDITVQLDATGNVSIVPADVDGGSSDNCGIASMTVTPNSFTCADVGDNPVVLEITDVNGNVSSCTAIVTVEDVTAPVASCMDITVQLDATGTVTITGSDVDGGSTDACGIADLSVSPDTFDCDDVGDNTVTLTVTDVNGNVSTCTAIVTVEDNIAPVLTCMDITLELDENGMASITPDDVIASNTDNCGIATSAVDITDFDCDDIGTPITVTVFTVDVNGNLASCTAVVTVVDLLGPDVTCPADQTVDPGPGNLFYTVPDYFATGEATATDNCTDPVTIFSQTPAAGTQIPDGVYTVEVCATDEYGNENCCTFELTVESILGNDEVTVDFGSITMYPNPARDVVMLSNPQGLDLNNVAIYDATGRLIRTIALEGMGTEKQIEIYDLASATYLFVISGDNGQITKQIIKE